MLATRMLTQPTDQPQIASSGRAARAPESGSQLLFGDAWTAWVLINLVRKRVIVRAFGVSPEDANAITLIGLALIAGSIHETWRRVVRRPKLTRADSVLAAGAARTLLGSIAGPAVSEMPGFGALIVLALVTHAARPTVSRSAHAVRSGWHRIALDFHQRYGSLASRTGG
jgi:hypothetical protein